MSASEPHIPTPEEFADLPRPVRPQLTPLQILSLAQLWDEYPELALELAKTEGDRFDRSIRNRQ